MQPAPRARSIAGRSRELVRHHEEGSLSQKRVIDRDRVGLVVDVDRVIGDASDYLGVCRSGGVEDESVADGRRVRARTVLIEGDVVRVETRAQIQSLDQLRVREFPDIEDFDLRLGTGSLVFARSELELYR